MRRRWSFTAHFGLAAAVLASVLGVAAAGRAAPRQPTSVLLQRLEAARVQLQQTQLQWSGVPGKEGELRVQEALDAFNAARLDAYGLADVRLNSGRGSFDGSISEVEPNDTAPSATSLDAAILREGSAVVTAEIRPGADADFFSFTAPAGVRVWAYVDTGGTQSGDSTSRDSVLTLLAPDQSTVVEVDDDDGTGNGGDGTIEGTLASTIAGRVVPAAGTYYLKVDAFNATSIISPYRLYVVLTNTAAVNETEPNGTIDTAGTLLPVGARTGYVGGAATGADLDVYRLALQAGDVATIQVDEDPTRDNTSSNTELALLTPAGALILSTADEAPDSAGGEGISFRASTAGVYFVRVRQVAAVIATDYTLMATVCTRLVLPNAPTVINGVLGSGSVDYPAISGKQVSRLFRDSFPSNSLAPKAFPGLSDLGTIRTFDAYVFQNRTAVEAPVTVQLLPSTGTNVFSVTHSVYDPGNVAVGYLADAGSSTGPPDGSKYSFRVAPGEVFVVVVHEVNVASAVGLPYTLRVSGDFRASLVGCPANITVPNDPNLAGAVVSYNAPQPSDPSLGPVVSSPPSGSFFPLGTTVVTNQDRTGNSCSFQVTVKDVQAPTITCPNSLVLNQDRPSGALVTYVATAADNSGSVNLVCTPASGSVFPLGSTVVTCTASDAAGNTSTCSFQVTVKDTQGPVVNCPASATALQDLAGGAIVSYTVTASDNSGSVNVTSSPASGSFFALGTTTVTSVAVDSSGNVSTCTFPVTVTAPGSTAGAKVTGSGTIANGTPAAKFKITASVAATGVPKLTFTHTQTGQALKSSSVSAIVKSGNLVKIFGKLRNGIGPERDFLLEVRDVAKPGATKDTYRLDVKGGFQQAQTTIATGEITVK